MSKSKSPSKARKKAEEQRLRTLATTIMERFAERGPVARCELYYRTPFHLLLSVMLSAQTTDKSVNDAVRDLYDADLTPQSLIAMGEAAFLARIRRIGLAPTKAKRALVLAQLLLERHGGSVPNDRAALEALPGVGRKTASVVLGEIFREPTLAVDTHVFRVTSRLQLHQEKTADGCTDRLLELIDRRFLPQAHHWLVLHGRYVCKALKPDCAHCLLSDLCPSCQLTVATKPTLKLPAKAAARLPAKTAASANQRRALVAARGKQALPPANPPTK